MVGLVMTLIDPKWQNQSILWVWTRYINIWPIYSEKSIFGNFKGAQMDQSNMNVSSICCEVNRAKFSIVLVKSGVAFRICSTRQNAFSRTFSFHFTPTLAKQHMSWFYLLPGTIPGLQSQQRHSNLHLSPHTRWR